MRSFVFAKKQLFFASLLIVPQSFVAWGPAWAGIESCGDINVDASATCRVEVEGGCDVKCTPLAFEAACAGQLEVSCRGECDLDAELQCTASCNVGTCVARCEVDPPSFQCSADCTARADAQCDAECQADANRGECTASCKSTFSAECDASCQGTGGNATCQAQCEASCEADCSARANLDCQVDCQSRGYLECKAELEGGCSAACSQPQGALFCDGQYVDDGGNLEACIDAIKAAVDVDVQASGTASGDCAGGRCEGNAEGTASASCGLGPNAASHPGAAAALGLLGMFGVFCARRRPAR
jgi:hypothetical protein